MAADRAAFIEQSQSFNVYMANPTRSQLTSMHFYGWKKGLKTGIYYLRTKAAAEPIKFTITSPDASGASCGVKSAEGCSSCSG